MESKTKGGHKKRKTLRKVLTSLFIVFFLFVLSAYFFMKSTYPAPLITYAMKRVTGMDVEISALTTGPWLRLTLNGLKVGPGKETLLYVDRLELVINLKGLISGRVVSLSAVKPVIFLSALPSASPSPPGGESSPQKSGDPLLSIPWFFSELIIKDGLIRQHGAASPILVGPLNLRLTSKRGNRVGLQASAYLPLLKTSAAIKSEVDMKDVGLQKGHVSLGLIKLEDMDAGGLSIIRGGHGVVKADFILERRDSSLGASMKLEFKDVTMPIMPASASSTGKLTASLVFNETLTEAALRAGLFLKEPGAGRAAYRAAFIKGVYDIKQKNLKITKAAFTTPSLGSIHLTGTVQGLPDRPVSMEIHLKAERVSLALLNETLLLPLSIEISGLKSGPGLSGRASIKGLLSDGLEWDMDLTLASPVRHGLYVLNLKDNPLNVSSKGVYYLPGDRLEIGSLRAALGSVAPLTLMGSLKALTSENPKMDFRLRGNALDLVRIKRAVSGPLLSDMALNGSLGTALYIKGGLYSPRVKGEVTLENTSFTAMGLAVKGMDTDLAFGYDKEGLSIESFVVSSQSLGLKGFSQWAGPAPKLLNTDLSIGSISYDGEVFRAGEINFKVNKAFFERSASIAPKHGKVFWEGPLPKLFTTGLTIRSFTYDGKAARAGGLNLKIDKALFESSGPKGENALDSPLPELLKTSLAIGAITYDGVLIRAGGLNLNIKKALFFKEGRPLFEERDITLSGAFNGDIVKNHFTAERFTFTAGLGARGWPGGLGGLKGEVSEAVLDLTGPARVSASIGLHGLSLNRLRVITSDLTGLAVDAEVSGVVETGLKVNMVFRGDETSLKAGIELGLKDGAFASADGALAVEGLRLKIGGRLDLSLPSKKAAFSMKGTARDFELLAGSFYGSFKDRPIEVAARGSYDPDKDELTVPALAVSLKPVGSLKAAARLSSITGSPRFEAITGSVDVSNQELYDLFLRDTLSETMPIFERLDVEGRTRLAMQAEGTSKDLALKGELQLRETGLKERDGGLSVKGMELNLPIELHYPEAVVRQSVGRSGRGAVKAFGSLKIRQASFGPVSISALKASPAIRGNALVFGEDIVIPLFGGTVTLGDIVFKDLLAPSRELGLHMDVVGIDLKRASLAIGLPPFGGTLSGGIPGIRLMAGNVSTEGEIKLKLFGGELKLTNMAVGQVFSLVPSFKSSIEIREINLGELTSAFEFGSITGVLQGRIEDLVLVKGQPESFFADIKTVKRRGVSQRINTKALENVSILGTGATASILNRGIYRLFDEYRYAKMGFQAQLKNDELLLLGIETQGDKGYIIKGSSLPPKVNVVSFTQRISFKEMMKRLNRVDLSATGDAVIE